VSAHVLSPTLDYLHEPEQASSGLAEGFQGFIGKPLGHKAPAITQRYAHLARDAVAAVNDELGAAMTAAIEKGRVATAANVLKLRRPRESK
jgi:hypothetical protein